MPLPVAAAAGCDRVRSTRKGTQCDWPGRLDPQPGVRCAADRRLRQRLQVMAELPAQAVVGRAANARRFWQALPAAAKCAPS